MRKILYFAVVFLAVLLVNGPFICIAEAARVAVAPVQVNDEKVARATDFTGYYWDIMIEKFPFPDYELVEDNAVEAVLPEGGLRSFDQATLEVIGEKTDAEIVVAMRLDEVKAKIDRGRHDSKTKCFMKGLFAGYNRLTGKYYVKKMNYSGKIETALTLKNDWQQQVFASNLKRYINRVLEDQSSKAANK